MGGRKSLAQPGVAGRARASTTRWVPSGSAIPVCARVEAQGDLGPEDGGQAGRAGGFGEADRPVHTVVVGDGQRLEPEAYCLFHELVGVRSTVEEAEIGVAMQLGVRAPSPTLSVYEHMFDYARPEVRGLTAGAARRCPRRQAPSMGAKVTCLQRHC